MLDNIFSIFYDGGIYFMLPLFFLSIVSLSVFIERLFVLHFKILLNKDTISNIQGYIYNGKTDDIIVLLENNNTLLGYIIRLGLIKAKNISQLRNSIEDVANIYIDKLESNLWILKAIGQLSPLIGLTGTVTGLAIAFKNISEVGISQESVANGISMALITTITGLVIVIPTIIFEFTLKALIKYKYVKIVEALDKISTMK